MIATMARILNRVPVLQADNREMLAKGKWQRQIAASIAVKASERTPIRRVGSGERVT